MLSRIRRRQCRHIGVFNVRKSARLQWLPSGLRTTCATPFTTRYRQSSAAFHSASSLTLRATQNQQTRAKEQPQQQTMTKSKSLEQAFIAHESIKSLLQSGDFKAAVEAIEKYHQEKGRLTTSTYNELLFHAVKANDAALVKKALDLIESTSLQKNAFTSHQLLRWYANTKQTAEFDKLWQDILRTNNMKIVNADVITFVTRTYRQRHAPTVVFEKILDFIKKNRRHFKMKGEAYFEILCAFREDPRPIFNRLYDQYVSQVEMEEVDAYPQIWVLAIRRFSTFRTGDWKKRVLYALNKAQNSGRDDQEYLNHLFYALAFTGISSMVKNALMAMPAVALSPSISYLESYCHCLVVKTFYSATVLGQPIKDSPGILPPDSLIISDIARAQDLARYLKLELNEMCYNFILLALARSRNFKEFEKQVEWLNSRNISLNTFGYIGQIMSTMYNSKLSVDDKLTRIEQLHQLALQTSPPTRLESYALRTLYETLMCAYAELEPGTTKLKAVAKEALAKNLRLYATMRLTMKAFELGKTAIDKVIAVIPKYWPQATAAKIVTSASYFLACMIDSVRKGAVVINDETPNNISLMRTAMENAIIETKKLELADLDTGICGLWAQLMASYGNTRAVREIIDLMSKKSNVTSGLKQYHDIYWAQLINAQISSQGVLSALKILDEMRAAGLSLSSHHYNRIFYACINHPEGTSLAMKIYNNLRSNGLRPDDATFKTMLSVSKNTSYQLDVIKEAKKFGITLMLQGQVLPEGNDRADDEITDACLV